MKKMMAMAASAVALVMFGACSGNNNTKNSDGQAANPGDEKVVYTGVLPGADVDQIRYTLTLDYDDDNTSKGDYDLVETYQQADSIAAGGMKDVKNVRSEGDFTVMNKDNNKYLQLTPDVKDSDASADGSVMYFLVENDSTIVMVNSDLQKSETPGMNYTLTRTK